MIWVLKLYGILAGINWILMNNINFKTVLLFFGCILFSFCFLIFNAKQISCKIKQLKVHVRQYCKGQWQWKIICKRDQIFIQRISFYLSFISFCKGIVPTLFSNFTIMVKRYELLASAAAATSPAVSGNSPEESQKPDHSHHKYMRGAIIIVVFSILVGFSFFFCIWKKVLPIFKHRLSLTKGQ